MNRLIQTRTVASKRGITRASCGPIQSHLPFRVPLVIDTRQLEELAQRLASLHFWLYQCVVDAKSSIDLGDAVELLEFQRDAWRDAVEVLRAGDATSPPKTIDLAG